MKIRSEDGRSIKKSDISLFINHLPNGKDTARFDTEDASGSTSQAANVVESMEAGANLLLIDEDTSATNFMIRDELMQRVIRREMEPITPFLDRVRELVRAGRYAQADKELADGFAGYASEAYLPLGELTVEYGDRTSPVSRYARRLELSRALYTASWCRGGRRREAA